MTKEEILKKVLSVDANQNWIDVCLFDDELDGDVSIVYSAMDEYTKQESIGFFKWYAIKMVTLLAYIKDIRPLVTSNAIEEKIEEFEGKSFDVLYSLYLKSKENVQ